MNLPPLPALPIEQFTTPFGQPNTKIIIKSPLPPVMPGKYTQNDVKVTLKGVEIKCQPCIEKNLTVEDFAEMEAYCSGDIKATGSFILDRAKIGSGLELDRLATFFNGAGVVRDPGETDDSFRKRLLDGVLDVKHIKAPTSDTVGGVTAADLKNLSTQFDPPSIGLNVDLETLQVTPDTVAVQYELTDWYPYTMRPTRVGEYELLNDTTGEIWRGKYTEDDCFLWENGSDVHTHWRGIRGLLWPGVGAVTIHAA